MGASAAPIPSLRVCPALTLWQGWTRCRFTPEMRVCRDDAARRGRSCESIALPGGFDVCAHRLIRSSSRARYCDGVGMEARAQSRPAGTDRGKAMTALTSTPALWTLALVGLYVVGVLRHIGELRAAHLPVEAAFETVPLRQHFIAGIATVVSPYTAILIAVAGLWYLQGREVDRRRPRHRSRSRVLDGISAVVVSVTLLALPWDTSALIVAMLSVMAGSIFLTRRAVASSAHALMLAFIFGAFVLLAGSAYFQGHLPGAAVARLASGETIRASYLGTTNGFTYLGKAGRIIATPAEQIRSVTITKGPNRSAPESIFQLVTGVRIGAKKLR